MIHGYKDSNTPHFLYVLLFDFFFTSLKYDCLSFSVMPSTLIIQTLLNVKSLPITSSFSIEKSEYDFCLQITVLVIRKLMLTSKVNNLISRVTCSSSWGTTSSYKISEKNTSSLWCLIRRYLRSFLAQDLVGRESDTTC